MKKVNIERCLDDIVIEKNIVFPTTVEDIRNTIQYCNDNQVSFHPVSAGNNWGYGSSTPNDNEVSIVMNLSKMPDVIHFDSDSGLLTFGPGLTQGKLYDYLTDNGHDYIIPVTGAGPDTNVMGNALERGFGITPIHDHVDSIRSVKAVLPDGSIYESCFAQMGLDTLDRHHKYTVGPNFDAIFCQSNFGVVYEMTIKLEKQPEKMIMFAASITHDELPAALEVLKDISETYKGFLSSLKVFNSRRILAMRSRYLAEVEGFCDEKTIKSLQKEYKVKDWQILGSIYGPKAITRVIKREIRQKLKGIGTEKKFIPSDHIILKNPKIGKMIIGEKVYESLVEGFSICKGKPSRYPLNLVYTRRNIADKDKNFHPVKDKSGIIWFATVIPLKLQLMKDYSDKMVATFKQYEMEPIFTFTLKDSNISMATMPILFDRANPGQVQKAHDLYRALLAASKEMGIYAYRIPTIFQEEFVNEIDWDNSLTKKLKSVIDPNNILAPGRYSKREEKRAKMAMDTTL